MIHSTNLHLSPFSYQTQVIHPNINLNLSQSLIDFRQINPQVNDAINTLVTPSHFTFRDNLQNRSGYNPLLLEAQALDVQVEPVADRQTPRSSDVRAGDTDQTQIHNHERFFRALAHEEVINRPNILNIIQRINRNPEYTSE